MRVYSPYQDYYEVVPPNAHEATYVRSYYGPPYAGKSLVCLAPDSVPAHGPSVGTRPHPFNDHGLPQAGPSARPFPSHPKTHISSWTRFLSHPRADL